MFTHKRSTQIFDIPYQVFTLLAITTTVGTIATTYNPESAVFANQTCQHNKCLKFNLIQIGDSWEFVVREVTPSCCSYAARNVTLFTQVSLSKSPYKMANATPTTTRDTEEDYGGPPVIDDARVTFSVDGFPKFVSEPTRTSTTTTSTTTKFVSEPAPTSTTTTPATQPIPKPAAQKATIAKKISQTLASFVKTICSGDNAA